MIIDKAAIYLRSGKGGEGGSGLSKLSSHKMVPSGGDGSKGGSIFLKVSPHLYDLSKFRGKKKFIAADGERGKQGNKKCKDAQDLIINLPLGTRVLSAGDISSGKGSEVITDLINKEDEFLICRGGRGGKGNYRRDYNMPAECGQEAEIILDYRIPNDVAILGFANSGKTALFNALTEQKRKVAEYAFTTNSLFWANSEYEFKRFTVLDTPPVKKSVSKSSQKSNFIDKNSLDLPENTFLRHIFRSKILLLLSDKASPEDDFKALEKEISFYDERFLATKKLFYLVSKVDIINKKNIGEKFLKLSINKPKTIEALKEKIFKNL